MTGYRPPPAILAAIDQRMASASDIVTELVLGAQQQLAHGRDHTRFWLVGGLLLVDPRAMSGSGLLMCAAAEAIVRLAEAENERQALEEHVAPDPSRAPADRRRCPGGCQHRIPLEQFVCDPCRDRLPFELRQALQAARGRDHTAYRHARHAARLWLGANPPSDAGGGQL